MMNYKSAGVDIQKADDFVKYIRRASNITTNPNVINEIGSFSALYEIPTGYKNPVLSSCTDGVGTKINVAIKFNDHRGIGQDLVAMCSNDLATTGAKPLFFLDYYSVGKLNTERDHQIIRGIADSCKEIGCAFIGGETAEMSTKFQESYELAGFMLGIQEKDSIIDGWRVERGNVLIGIESNGIHANGFTLVRQLEVENQYYFELLKPTYIYNNVVTSVLNQVPVNAMAHITGGGIYNNVKRVIPSDANIYLNNKWEIPLIFSLIKSYGIELSEMKKVFNMGIGYVFVVDKDHENIVLNIINACQFKGYKIGEIY